MKKVLIISFYFPPSPNIGAQRPYRLAKYLPKFGWEPIILTSKLPGIPPELIRKIETDYKDILNEIKLKIGFNTNETVHEQLGIEVSKNFNYSTWKSKSFKLLKEFLAYPDRERGWLGSLHQLAVTFGQQGWRIPPDSNQPMGGN